MLPALHVKGVTGESILIDAGEGTQLQLNKANISINRINIILITHMHGDHIFGLPGLLENMSLTGRTKDLLIIGPSGLVDYIAESFKATYFYPRYRLYYGEISGWGSYKYGSITIEWFPVCHTIETYGYKLIYHKRPRLSKEKLGQVGLLNSPLTSKLLQEGEVVVSGRKVRLEDVLAEPAKKYCLAYTGDTAPCARIIEEVKGCDILFHEATFASDHRYEAWEYGHSTAMDAAIIAEEAGVGKLVLYHNSTRYKENYNILEEEARDIFPNAELGVDLGEYVI
ncbi:MAG: ribonuclease Z [Desulfurococcales archaeon]|nr:ribonuclease Z [Desulfurococcales archaeon]